MRVSGTLRIQVGSVHAELRKVQLPIGLVLDLIRIDGDALQLQPNPFEAHLPQPGKLEVEIGNESLAAFLESRSPAGLRNFKVDIRDGKVFIQATKKIVVDVKASAVCTLRIEGNQQIFVDLESVDVMGGSLKNLVQSQLDEMNPVFDAKDLPVAAALRSVKSANGKIQIMGSVTPNRSSG